MKNRVVIVITIFCLIVLVFKFSSWSGEPETRIDKAILLRGNLECVKIKKKQFQWSMDIPGATVPVGVQLKVIYREPGEYTIKTWQRQYRNVDLLGESFIETITETPIEKTYNLKKDFYRLEVVFANKEGIILDSTSLGSMNHSWPDVVAEIK